MTGDGQVKNSDCIFWMTQIARIAPGDSNGDGRFTSSDLVQVFKATGYEDALVRNSGWAEGDWNGDLEFDGADLAFVFLDGQYEHEPFGGPNAVVPEPSLRVLLFGG